MRNINLYDTKVFRKQKYCNFKMDQKSDAKQTQRDCSISENHKLRSIIEKKTYE